MAVRSVDGVIGGHSLREILEIFSRDVMTESDVCDYGLITRNGETWFKRELALKMPPENWA